MSKKRIILISALVVFMLFFDFSLVDNNLSEGLGCGEYSPTHRTDKDLWIRNEVPGYSFRTGDWVLGEKIGVIKRNTQFQIKDTIIVGYTQVWLQICFQLPEGVW